MPIDLQDTDEDDDYGNVDSLEEMKKEQDLKRAEEARQRTEEAALIEVQDQDTE